MYVEPVRNVVPVANVPKTQSVSTGNVIQMVSKDGETEQNTIKENATKNRSERPAVADFQSSENSCKILKIHV